jgi:hypothetical protein
MTRVRLAAAAGVAAMALSTQAHPGHGPLSQGAAHFFTSPYHVIPPVLGGVALYIAGSFLKQSKARAAMRTAGAMVALGAIALWGIGA